MIDDELATLPLAPVDRPVEEWSAPELLIDNARLGLLNLRKILSQEWDTDDLKKQRLIGDYSLGSAKLLARVQEAAMRADAPNRWAELLAKIEQAKLIAPPSID